MSFATEYARMNKKQIPKSWIINESAGKDWFRGFPLRNPELSLRTPETTSLSRSTSFNRKNVRDKYKFEPQNIYNYDGTGCSTVQEIQKVIASKTQCKIGLPTRWETLDRYRFQ
nr:unnamed protein product [Callosobruchus analis]